MTESIGAASLRHASSLFSMRRRREDWLEARGILQWPKGMVTQAAIEEQIAAGQWLVLHGATGALEAAMRLLCNYGFTEVGQRDLPGFSATLMQTLL